LDAPLDVDDQDCAEALAQQVAERPDRRPVEVAVDLGPFQERAAARAASNASRVVK
jgi:transcriptional regulatory protein LevR